MPEAKDWFTRHRGVSLWAVFLLSLAVRLATAEYMDLGGDNARRWMEVHRLLAGLGFSKWDHQTVRWALNLPLWGLMKLFGPHPAIYAVLPVTLASAGAVLLCLIGERLHSLRLGVTAGVLSVFFPIMAETGSQMWPSVFQLAFVSASVWLILVWLERGGAHLLVLAGLGFFLTWGASVSAIYFLPGLLLLIWLPSRSFRALVVFCATVGLCCVGEWAFFWAMTGNRLGAVGLVGGTHGIKPQLIIPLGEYLLNFLNYKKLRGLLPIMILSLVACVPMFRSRDRRRQALAGLYLGFVFLLTYMIAGLHPLRQAQPFGTRYWAAGASFGLLLIVLWLFDHLERRPRLVKGCLAVLLAAFVLFSIKLVPPTNNVFQMARDYEVVPPALAAGRPVLTRYEPWQPDLAEKLLMRWFMGSAKPRTRKLSEMDLDMARNVDRMLALYLADVGRYEEYARVPLRRLSEFEYLYVPPGASEDAPPAVETVFGRKLSASSPLPAPQP